MVSPEALTIPHPSPPPASGERGEEREEPESEP
jgi:hypothetical protein